jgi:hypothetical protein
MPATPKGPKYRRGDIVGVCGDRMYEFRILSWYPEHKVYSARCVRSAGDGEVKLGERRAVKPSQIVVKLGENGVKWPPPDFEPPKKKKRK